MTNSENTYEHHDFDFNGLWLSTDGKRVFTLEQSEQRVTGVYVGPDTGNIEGTVQGNRLEFTWSSFGVDHNSGQGVMEGVIGLRKVIGLWKPAADETSGETFEAVSDSTHPSTREGLDKDDKLVLKQTGYEFVRLGQYEQAIDRLEKALQLYKREMVDKPFLQDSYLLDEVRIRANLLQCYFALAHNKEFPGVQMYKDHLPQFYKKLLENLELSVGAYRHFLQRTFQRHTLTPIQELKSAADSLDHWREQLQNQAEVLKKDNEYDSRIPRMTELATLLQSMHEYLIDESNTLVEHGKQSFGQHGELVHSLIELGNYYQNLEQAIKKDVQQMQALGASWPEDQREFIQWLTLLLAALPAHLEGQRKLIEQTRQSAKERVDYTWDSANRLSLWLDRWRRMLSGDAEKIEALQEGQTFFHQIIQFYVSMQQEKTALLLSEQSRARAFADLLAKNTHNPSKGEVLHASTPTSLNDIREVVKQRKSTTIEYFLTSDRLILWIISAVGDITCIVKDIQGERPDALVKTFLKLVQSLEPTPEERKQLSEVLQKLHAYLIQPIPAELLPKSAEDIITIIPHGSLFHVPFAALKSKEGRYFIEDHTIVYSSSIDIMRYTANNKLQAVSTQEPTLLAFINPHFPKESKLTTLKYTEDYFDTVLAFYSDTQKCKIYKGEEATKQVFLQEAESYTVLCFVTHGKALDHDPLNSYLVLASNVEEERLRVSEILRLHLHADLVLLSACETGVGHITGDGVNDLSRAFTAAGASSLLVSLWSIPEKESLGQLYQFHSSWRGSGTTKASALRDAQLESLNNYREQPDVWAAFILVGE